MARVHAADDSYELEEPCGKVTVSEKWQGTAEDRRDMQILGRVQELRVRVGVLYSYPFERRAMC